MSPTLDGGSFRDREGRVFYQQGRVYRALSGTAQAAWRAFAASTFFAQAVERGSIVETHEVDFDAASGTDLTRADLEALSPHWVTALEHARVPFLSYPYEWPFSMLRDAAGLQLDLTRQALDEDLITKDATPYNVQWQGAQPTFIDIASFEPWKEGQPWVGYLQFCQLFLYPLLITAHRNLPFQPWLRGAIDGITPEQANALFSFRDRFKAGVLADVYLQAKLQAKTAAKEKPMRKDLASAGFSKPMIANNIDRLRRLVAKLEWRESASEWADYAETNTYDETAHQAKVAFVESVAAERRRSLAWDLGCNTGTFSRLIAQHTDYVIAIDADVLAVERMYRTLRQNGPANVLPLIGNLADAAPGLGWRNRERKTLVDRGQPELVLALALIHHLVISANIPLPDLIDWFGELGSDLVIEWVGKDDAMVERLLRNKDDIYDDYTPEVLETSLARHFTIERRETIHGGTRTLYFARPLRG